MAAEVGAVGVPADVTREADVQALVREATRRHGRIDIYCSNAGIGVAGGPEVPDAEWQRCWEVHVMAHVYAARAVLPGMLERGGGYLLGTVSAAGLLNHVLAAPYAVALLVPAATDGVVTGMLVGLAFGSGRALAPLQAVAADDRHWARDVGRVSRVVERAASVVVALVAVALVTHG